LIAEDPAKVLLLRHIVPAFDDINPQGSLLPALRFNQNRSSNFDETVARVRPFANSSFCGFRRP
jgi:hypothetical protein